MCERWRDGEGDGGRERERVKGGEGDLHHETAEARVDSRDARLRVHFNKHVLCLGMSIVISIAIYPRYSTRSSTSCNREYARRHARREASL